MVALSDPGPVRVHHNSMSFQRSSRMVNTSRMVARKLLRKSDTTPSVTPVRVRVPVEEYTNVLIPSLNPTYMLISQMYTANTMASAAEALGMTLPGGSSFPAEYKEKLDECDSVGPALKHLVEKNILPHDIMTRTAFENAMVRVRSNCKSLYTFHSIV